MRKDLEDKMHRAKAWCFDNGVTLDQIETAWNNALAQDVMVIKNFNNNGQKWWILPPHLLQQLIERYSV